MPRRPCWWSGWGRTTIFGQPGALFVGAVVKHDIAELVDPHINIVAKVPKAALAHLKK